MIEVQCRNKHFCIVRGGERRSTRSMQSYRSARITEGTLIAYPLA